MLTKQIECFKIETVADGKSRTCELYRRMCDESGEARFSF